MEESDNEMDQDEESNDVDAELESQKSFPIVDVKQEDVLGFGSDNINDGDAELESQKSFTNVDVKQEDVEGFGPDYMKVNESLELQDKKVIVQKEQEFVDSKAFNADEYEMDIMQNIGNTFNDSIKVEDTFFLTEETHVPETLINNIKTETNSPEGMINDCLLYTSDAADE